MIKTQTNQVRVLTVADESVVLLPPNDRRIGVIIASYGAGNIAVGVGLNPSTFDDGLPVCDDGLSAIFPPLKLTIGEFGSAIQQQISIFSSSSNIVVVALEFLASP